MRLRNFGKKTLSILLALMMLVGMLPGSVLTAFAVDADGNYEVGDTWETGYASNAPPTAPDGTVWVLTATEGPNSLGYSSVCGKTAHTHTAACYGNPDCHTHTQVCASSWTKANVLDGCSTNLCGSDHAAHYTTTTTKYGITTTTYYYTTNVDQCDHDHVALDCDGNTWTCSVGSGGTYKSHTHSEGNGCYKYTWTLYADANDNGEGDGTDADPYYTVVYTDGVEDAEVFADQTHSNVLNSELNSTSYEGTISREGYHFTGWNETTADLTVTRTATWAAITYIWVDENSTTELYRETYNGSVPTYVGEEPVNADADKHFAGWSAGVEDTDAHTITYTATYDNDDHAKVTYTWVDGNGVTQTKEFTINVTDGDVVPSIDAPAKDDWYFNGWTNSDLIGKTTYANAVIVLEATWLPDANNNGKPDGNETATVVLSVSEGGTATLTNGGNDKIIITNDGNVYTVVFDSTDAESGDLVYVSTTVGGKPATNQAYYLSKVEGAVEGKVEVADDDNKTVTVTYTLETFTLPTVEGGYAIEINGYSNETKVETNLKKLVLDAIFGAGNYNINDYKVELKTTYSLGSLNLGEKYYNVEGETYNGILSLWQDVNISPEWFVTQLETAIKGEEAKYGDFKITKLASSNASGVDLYIENVMIAAWETREKTEDIVLEDQDYTEDTLDDVIAAIKNNVKVNGGTVSGLTVTLTPEEQTLGTTKQEWTATVTAPATAEYLESTAAFTITADINVYTIKWDVDGVVTEETYAYGETIVAPADPEKEGYTFAGWNNGWATGTTASKDITYTAQWTVNSYKYTVNTYVMGLNGDYQLESSEVLTAEYGSTVTVTPEARTGFTAASTSVEGTIPANDSLVLTVYYARSQYDITWTYKVVENGAVVEKTYIDEDVYYGASIEAYEVDRYYEIVENDEIVRYYFQGWNIADGAIVTGDMKFDATYEPTVVYEVKFDSNGGISASTQYIEKGKLASEPTTALDGYRFDGWYLNGSLYDFSTPVTADITLTAKWSLYVAEVNGTKYVSLQDAVNAAASGDTIEILCSFVLPKMVWVGYEAKDIKTLTIDLNGYTVSINGTAIVANRQGTEVTFINGTIQGNNSGGSIKATSGGKLILGNGAVVTCGGGSATAIVINGGYLVVEEGASVTTAAKILGTKVGVIVAENAKGVEIYGGSFVGPIVIDEAAAENVIIKGGYFSDETVSNYVYPGYSADPDTDNDDEVAETTVKVVNHDTVNSNGVKDEDETITVTQTGNGSFEVTGAVPIGDGKYVFDSVNDPSVSIVATPVVTDGISSSYVASINDVELTYGNGFAATATLDVENGDEIEIVFEDVPVVKASSVVEYNFYTKVIPYDDIYNAVISAPAIFGDAEVAYTYYAREAMSHTVSIDSLDLDASVKTLLSTLGITEFTFDMDELWLPLDAQIEESVDLNTAVSTYLTKERINGLYDLYQAAYDAAYPDAYNKAYQSYVDTVGTTIGANTYAKAEAAVVAAAAGVAAAKVDIDLIYEEVYAAAMYYGAHNFGYNPTGAETVDEIIKIEYSSSAMYWTAEATVTLKDPREVSYIDGTDIELTYRDYTDEDILALFGLVDANGEPIDGVIYSLQLSDPYTFEGKNASDTAYELTIKFAGNADYRAAEKTFNVTIVKAGAAIDVPNINVTYGEEYDPTPDVTLDNLYGEEKEIIDSLVEIIIGLDVADLEITEDGVSGVATHIQILLPEDETLAAIFKMIGLDVYGEGVTLNLTELQGYLDQINGLLTDYDSGNETMDAISSVLGSVTGLVDLSNVEITFGGSYPTDIGVYLYGAVSTSSNYETAYDVGYIIIQPKTEQVYLDWNYTGTNGVFTWELLEYVDLGASAFDDEALTSLNGTATEQILTLFVGIDEEGNVVYTWDASELGNGAYSEIAFIAEFGNEFYYAVPIARPVVIVPNVLDVQIVDKNGDAQDVFEYEFDNTEKTHYVTVDGKQVAVEINYVGVRTNTNVYESTTAPTHAGAYVAYVTYMTYNEAGELTAVGADVATVVIAPTDSTIDVEDITIVEEQKDVDHIFSDLVNAGSTVPGLKPDTTIISLGINTDGDFSAEGWSAVGNTANVDFPAWLDSFLAEHAPDVMASGITVGQLVEKLTDRVDDYAAKLVELGATEEIANSFTNLVENVTAALADLPSDTVLTFNDDAYAHSVGAYLIVGIVTDSDHIPAVDAGILVITPSVDQVYLDWNYHDENGIWTRELLKARDLFATAYNDEAYTDKNATATGLITYQFIGVDVNGNLVVTSDASTLANGAYVEMAYIELEIDGHMYISDMIARPIVVSPNTVDVSFVDGNDNNQFLREFDNEPQDLEVKVTYDGNAFEIDLDNLTVTYVGVQTNGKEYNSTVAPTQAGVYVVTATYLQKDAEGNVIALGADVAVLVVEPADSTIDVTGGSVVYDGNGHTANVTVTGGNIKPDYTLISGGATVSGDLSEIGVDALHGNVNIDFPKWLDAYLAEHEFATEGVDAAYLIDFIGSYRDDLVAAIPVDELVALGVDADTINGYIDQLNAYIDELLAVLEKLPEDVNLTFEDNITYTEPGYYFYYGIVTDSDHYPSTDTGLLVIEKMDMLFGAWHTVVPYDGNGHTVYVPNDYSNVEGAPTVDYITMVVDREANTVNLILDADAAYILKTLERILDIELPDDMDIADLRATLAENGVSVDEFAGALVELIDTILADMEKPTDPEEYSKSTYRNLEQIKDILANLPENGTITINGALPVDVGAYEFYLLSYSEYYQTQAASAVLFIEPIRVVIDDIANGKYYGETDPTLEADVYYYSYEGLEIVNSGAKGNYENDYNFKDHTDNIWVEKVTINTLPDDIELSYTVTRKGGEDVGEYELYINGSIVDSKNYVLETVEDDVFTISPAEITIIVNDASKVYGENDPTIDYTFDVNKGVVTESQIGLNITREPGQNVGTYDYIVEYTDSKNWIVTVDAGALTITKAKVTVTVESATITYGDDIPDVVLTYSNELAKELNIQMTWNAVKGSPVGTYGSNFTWINYQNWIVEYVPGNLTIIPAEIVSVDASDLTYNGKEQKTTLTIIGVNGEVLVEGVDYEIVSGNTGKNVDTYTVTIKGIGNYTGEYTAEWKITPAALESVEVTGEYTYNGSEQTATVVVKDVYGNTLTEGVDYTVTGNTGKNAGTYTVTVEGIGNYAGELSTTWKIAKAKVTVTVNSDSVVYGDEIPAVELTYSDALAESELNIQMTWNAVQGSDAGTYGSNFTWINYENWVVEYVPGNLTITKRVVTVTVESDKDICIDSDMPEFTVKVENGFNGEVTATVNTNGVDLNKVGTYTVTADVTYNENNYEIVYVNATVTVNKHMEVTSEITNVVKATCTEDGSYVITYYCTCCGEKINSETVAIKATGHSGEVLYHQPTCTEDGYWEGICVKCGETFFYQELGEATGHSGEVKFVWPTCTEDGYGEGVCDICGEVFYHVDMPATGHSYESVVTDSTCTKDGYTTHTCTVCGDSYMTDLVPAHGHNLSVVVNQPTCTEKGTIVGTCTECGIVIQHAETPAKGHQYESVVTDPTCTEAGYTTHTCTVCGDSYVDTEVAAKGHTYGTLQVHSFCEEEGYIEITCNQCGEHFDSRYDEEAQDYLTEWSWMINVAPHGHDWDDGVVTTEPTTSTAGVKTYTCKHDANHTYTETIQPTDAVCWNPVTGQVWDDLSDALDEVDLNDETETIVMLKDYTERLVYIGSGTTLDLAGYTVTAKYVEAAEDAYLTGNINSGKLVVDKDDLDLEEDCYHDESVGFDVLPVWVADESYANGGYYTFFRFEATTTPKADVSSTNARGLTVDEDAKSIYFQFGLNMSKDVRALLNDGGEDNNVQVVVRLTWTSADGVAYQDFVYNKDQLATVAGGGYDFGFTMTNYDELGIDINTVTVQALVVTESGAVSCGDKWGYSTETGSYIITEE